jgi:hypothetical protein
MNDNEAIQSCSRPRRQPWNKGKLIGAKPPLRGQRGNPSRVHLRVLVAAMKGFPRILSRDDSENRIDETPLESLPCERSSQVNTGNAHSSNGGEIEGTSQRGIALLRLNQ